MEFSYLSLLGGLLMLIAGVLAHAALRAVLYRPLRWRHEAAKARGRIGTDPDRVMTVLKFVSLVLLPVLGFLLGHAVLEGMAPH